MSGVKKSNHKGTRFFVKVMRADPCAYCGKYYVPKKKNNPKMFGQKWSTIDHIHPKANGGLNTWMNYTPSCPSCNTKKAGNSLLGFLLETYIPSKSPQKPVDDQPRHWFDPLGIAPRTKRKNLPRRFDDRP